jgi:cobyrinic acid a,c-diamide synthase
MIKKLAAIVEEGLQLERLLKSLPDVAPADKQAVIERDRKSAAVRIGVARDNAFCFYYPDNLDLLEASGAELVFFSPIADPRLPADLDGLYLGGGYPELAADRLAANSDLRNQIRDASLSGMPIYAECGGFMYLCRELSDQNQRHYPMAGCFPFSAQMQPRLKALGYREITLTKDTLIGPAGQTMRGHEFHYSEIKSTEPGMDTVYRLTDRVGVDKPPSGYYTHHTLGSYVHLHFGSQPQIARSFVQTCRTYRDERR